MNEKELMSWMQHCPVCGRELTYATSMAAECVVGHGSFRIVNGFIVFELDPNSEDGEE